VCNHAFPKRSPARAKMSEERIRKKISHKNLAAGDKCEKGAVCFINKIIIECANLIFLQALVKEDVVIKK
jgi:hypothetical protein